MYTHHHLPASPRSIFNSQEPPRNTGVMANSTLVNSGKKLIQIDITADTVCPWCFLGKKNLEKAMEQVKDQYDFELKWHPFFLDPSAPKEGVKKTEYFKQKFGEGQTQQMFARMTEIFRCLGLEFDTSGLTQILLDAASKFGIEGAAELLEDPSKGLLEVNEELEKYSTRISGVPHFFINGKYNISGGQPPEVFLRAFQAAARD